MQTWIVIALLFACIVFWNRFRSRPDEVLRVTAAAAKSRKYELERFRQSRFQNVQISDLVVSTWRNEFHPELVRHFVGANQIDLADLQMLRSNRAAELDAVVAQRLNQIHGPLWSYPHEKPTVDWAPQMPSEPDPIFISEVLALVSGRKLNKRDELEVRTKIDLFNQEIKEDYLSVLERYEMVVETGKRKLLQIEDEYKNITASWENNRDAETKYLKFILNSISECENVEKTVKIIVDNLKYPKWMPIRFDVRYDRQSEIVFIEHEFPNIENIEWVRRVELKRSTSLKSATKADIKNATMELYPALTLFIATTISKILPVGTFNSIVINGWAEFHSKSTGELKRAYCSSLIATQTQLIGIDLEHANPIAAFASLKGNASRSLDLTPIAPVLRLDMTDSRFIDAREVLSNLQGGQNLASMDWDDFEHLCRELFERVFASAGATVSVTQASRDQGVDAIILDPDPIRGGKIVIQAKRYVNTVDVSAVRDLWGTVSHEGAMKGLLVTTSQFGPDSYTFAQDKPLTLINGPELLYLLEENGYTFRIDLEDARKQQRENGGLPFQRKPKADSDERD